MTLSTAILDMTNVWAGFGAHTVLHGVTMHVDDGDIIALVGLNGAGKSVAISSISGLVEPWWGEILFQGVDVVGHAPEDIVGAGLAQVPQRRSVFPHLSVNENLRLGAAALGRDKLRIAWARERVLVMFPRLAKRLGDLAGQLSGGEQAMLAVGRALMSEPRMVLVDEASAGLSPVALEHLAEVLEAVRSWGTTILIIEQNMGFALKLADRVYLMEKGRIVLECQGDALRADPSDLFKRLGVGSLVEAPGATRHPAAVSRVGAAERVRRRRSRGVKRPSE